MEHSRVSKGYQEAKGLSLNCPACSILHLLIKNCIQNPQPYIGIQYFYPTILYTGTCGYCKQRIKENSEIGFPNEEGRVAEFSSSRDYIFKNNTVMCSGVLQQVQIHTLIEIKVIHHIDLNDSDESKKKEILTSSWK